MGTVSGKKGYNKSSGNGGALASSRLRLSDRVYVQKSLQKRARNRFPASAQ